MLLNLLAALAAVVVVGRLLGRLFRRFGQPAVIGEVLAGILLGPSFLGGVAPDVSAFLLPPSTAASLGLVSQLGIVLYMFQVGLELNPDALRGRLRTTLAISNASIAVPFVAGLALSVWLYDAHAPAGVPPVTFALFIGVAMSITAFPVLARILADRGMTRTPLGELALTCAAVGDVTAWCLLAYVVGVARTDAPSAVLVAAMTLAFIAVVFVAIRPLVVRWSRRYDLRGPDSGAIALCLVGALVAALLTEAIGVHAIFGAFLAGAIVPHDSALARGLERSLQDVVSILLLPAFFAFAGMRTEIGLLTGIAAWGLCGLIILVATLGKVGGTFLAARATGLSRRDATRLGALMNTRGLMELIVLNVGLDLGVISPALFTMLVIMALVTTVATAPALALLPSSSQPPLRGRAR
jgi:Kef-type K+ transport system membrane component KefB